LAATLFVANDGEPLAQRRGKIDNYFIHRFELFS
jgi:hypothetical protein